MFLVRGIEPVVNGLCLFAGAFHGLQWHSFLVLACSCLPLLAGGATLLLHGEALEERERGVIIALSLWSIRKVILYPGYGMFYGKAIYAEKRTNCQDEKSITSRSAF